MPARIRKPLKATRQKRAASEAEAPMRQGDLDYLCSVYAVMNLLRERGKIKSPEDQIHWFRHLIQAIALEGDLASYLLEGVDPNSDVLWLLNRAGFESGRPVEKPSLARIHAEKRQGHHMLIYLRSGEFTHYSLVGKDTSDHRIGLIDSYGFCALEQTEGGLFLEGPRAPDENVTISHLWKIKN